ncbi:MAG: hypothetical protein A2365_00995 [Candidatus Nealsonbacteria bacterium RIFOXYB1_FULL_40_15]|uniref:Ribonuclease J C-terminal domain-containing protein n=2 Tax=Candidatus Nealsoniibacteriota TaxID=1817911 RepID=A0A1G2EMU1_9BACT|nr:MAG: hypothetical protein A2365_00995 [Candidatus Nealsonbacteria bacterium RIFOXYB1_FULL_40_15]
MLKEGAKIAVKAGMDKRNIAVPDNGSIIETGRDIKILDKKVLTNYVFVDGSGIGDVGEVVLNDRKKMAESGIFVIVAVIDRKTGKVLGSPDIISRGFIYLKESKALLAETRKKLVGIIHKANSTNGAINWANMKDEIKSKLSDFFFSRTERRPIIIPVIIEV